MPVHFVKHNLPELSTVYPIMLWPIFLQLLVAKHWTTECQSKSFQTIFPLVK